jgi:hypothetical protein
MMHTHSEFKTTKSRLLASEIWHAMRDAPKYIDGKAIGNCEALTAGAAIIETALKDAYDEGRRDGEAYASL